jgi:hypothetical protein
MRYYKKNKFMFVLFVVGGIINAIIFCYLYGNLLPMVQNRHSTEQYYRTYEVVFDEPLDFSTAAGLLKQTTLFTDVSLAFAVTEKTDGTDTSNKQFEFAVCLNDKLPVVKRTGSVDIPTGNEIVISGRLTNDIGDNIELCGRSFVIKGIHTDGPYYISKEMYEKMFGQQVNKIFAISADNYSSGRDKPAEFLSESFPEGDVKAPTLIRLTDRNNSVAFLISICIAYFITSIAYSYLLLYIMESCADENVVSMIVGASKLAVGVMSFWEGVMMAFISSVIGIIIHIALTPVLFSKINMSSVLKYSFADYSFILLLIFVMSSVVVLFTIIRLTKETPATARRMIS